MALDVDGTCAELNPDPKAVKLVPGLIREVKALQEMGVTLVFITGRAGSEIGDGPQQVYPELLDFERYTDHGAIFRGVGRGATPTPTHARVKSAVGRIPRLKGALEGRISAQLAARLGQAAAAKLLIGRFELKDLGLAIHWRGQAREAAGKLKQAAQKAWASLPVRQRRGFSFAPFGDVTNETPLRDGMELRISGVTKGNSIRHLARRHQLLRGHRRRLIFIGDSGTDENGFTALRKIFPGGIALGIRVDATGHIKTAASARLKSPGDVLAFLSRLRERLRRP